ncbi:G/T mismatch-specific thymine DNA glycosylase-like isoform X2 [Ornithodoros turicata]
MEEYSSSGSMHSSTSSGAWNPPTMLIKQEPNQANFGFYGQEAPPLHHPPTNHQGHSMSQPGEYLQQSPYFEGGHAGAGHGWHNPGEVCGPPPPSAEEESVPRKRGRKKLQAEAGLDPERPIVRKRGRPRKYPLMDGCKGMGETVDGMKQERITDTFKQRKKIDRFEGMPEEEVAKRTLPDHLVPNLDIVIIGINPGLFAAFKGHHYAGPGNHFWRCLFLAGLIPEPMTAVDDFKLIKYGIGFTNIVARTTRSSADLSRKEIKEGAEILLDKLKAFQPRIAVFNGKGIYEIFSGNKNFVFGRQPEPIEGTNVSVFVMPSSSARCAQLPRAVDKLPFYVALKKLRDHLRGLLPALHPSEVTFPDVKLRVEAKDEFDAVADEQDCQEPLEGGMPSYPQIKEEPGLASCPRQENPPTPRKRGRRKKSELAQSGPQAPPLPQQQQQQQQQQHYPSQHHPHYNPQPQHPQQQSHNPMPIHYNHMHSAPYYRDNNYRGENYHDNSYRGEEYRAGPDYRENEYRENYGGPTYASNWSEEVQNYGNSAPEMGGMEPQQECSMPPNDGCHGSSEAQYAGGSAMDGSVPGSNWAYPSTYEPSEDLCRSDFPSWIKQEPLEGCESGGAY